MAYGCNIYAQRISDRIGPGEWYHVEKIETENEYNQFHVLYVSILIYNEEEIQTIVLRNKINI